MEILDLKTIRQAEGGAASSWDVRGRTNTRGAKGAGVQGKTYLGSKQKRGANWESEAPNWMSVRALGGNSSMDREITVSSENSEKVCKMDLHCYSGNQTGSVIQNAGGLVMCREKKESLSPRVHP